MDEQNYLHIFINSGSHILIILPLIFDPMIRDILFDAILSSQYFKKVFRDALGISRCVSLLRSRMMAEDPCLFRKAMDNRFINKLRKKVFKQESLKHFMISQVMVNHLTYVFPDLPDRLASNVEVTKNARILAQGKRSTTGFFSHLPTELLVKIAQNSKTHPDHSDKDAMKLAADNLNKPWVERKK